MGNQYGTLADIVADLQFPHIRAGLRRHTHPLPVLQAHCLGVGGINGYSAGPFAFIPRRVSHQGVGIVLRVPSGVE